MNESRDRNFHTQTEARLFSFLLILIIIIIVIIVIEKKYYASTVSYRLQRLTQTFLILGQTGKNKQ